MYKQTLLTSKEIKILDSIIEHILKEIPQNLKHEERNIHILRRHFNGNLSHKIKENNNVFG